MKLKNVIFGAADLGQALHLRIKSSSEVLFFVDNNHHNYSGTAKLPLPVLPPTALLESEFDFVYIAAAAGLEGIYKQLLEMGIPEYKINRMWGESSHYLAECRVYRIRFLEQYAEYAYYHGIKGSVAECGVYSGEFAKEINRVFPDRTLYLFDTFEGFDDRDLEKERAINPRFDQLRNWIDDIQGFSTTNIETVMDKLPYSDKCVMKQGFFPDTFDLDEEIFAFVNLDMDLYAPIKAGLEIFYPKMSSGGIILVHDYFDSSASLKPAVDECQQKNQLVAYHSVLDGVRLAVDEFLQENQLVAIPIGDFKSIAIVKP